MRPGGCAEACFATRRRGENLGERFRIRRLMPVPAACLFDLDGLLLDTEPLHGEAWAAAAAHFGTALTPEQLLQLRGRRRRDCADQVVAWIKAEVSCDALLAIQQPIARRLMPTASANPGAAALVNWCAKHQVPMALVTSSSQDSVGTKTSGHPWIGQIETRVLGDDPALGAGKPAPDPFLLAAQRLGVAADQCWAFEDSLAGSRAALAAGCQLWVLNPHGDGQSLRHKLPAGTWKEIQNLEQVVGQLEKGD